ncbi:hypothetical protein MRX96_008469 [Rhipicephalus microplus]
MLEDLCLEVRDEYSTPISNTQQVCPPDSPVLPSSPASSRCPLPTKVSFSGATHPTASIIPSASTTRPGGGAARGSGGAIDVVRTGAPSWQVCRFPHRQLHRQAHDHGRRAGTPGAIRAANPHG